MSPFVRTACDSVEIAQFFVRLSTRPGLCQQVVGHRNPPKRLDVVSKKFGLCIADFRDLGRLDLVSGVGMGFVLAQG